MKKIQKFITLALSIILVAVSLVSCSPKLVFANGKILDKSTDIYYNYAPNTYEAVAVAKAVYTYWEQNDVEVAYHAIEGLPTSEYLVDEFGYVICAEGKDLPDLSGFGARSALLCTNTEVAMSIAEITNQATISALVDIYMNAQGETFSNTAIDTLSIKFISNDYPHLYFSLSVLIEEDSSVYLWNRDNGRYVSVGTLLDEYLASYIE